MTAREYAAREEKIFEINLLNGYKRQTTFASDYALAECFGVKAIKDTFKRTTQQWIGNVKYYTELVLVLNHRCWLFYERAGKATSDIERDTMMKRSELYAELYYKAHDKGLGKFRGKDLDYYLSVLD